MTKNRKSSRAWLALALTSALAITGVAQAGSPAGDPGASQPGARVNPFGGGAFPGGHLRYTYTISRQGMARPATTTTEIAPLPDGAYSVVSTSTETLPLEMVNIGFFGIALGRLGVRVPEAAGGTLDLSPLGSIASAAIEPGRNYILPDGGRFRAGELGMIAGIQVVYGTYTHADFANVEIELAFAMDLAIRALLPFPARMVLRYSTAGRPLQVFSAVELTEFSYRP